MLGSILIESLVQKILHCHFHFVFPLPIDEKILSQEFHYVTTSQYVSIILFSFLSLHTVVGVIMSFHALCFLAMLV